ncbi:MAG: DUF1156 domain-containing protein [Chitinophagales bacterium]|nr:DUF1156 domain-containing protein [Chitinophagales bacterium]
MSSPKKLIEAAIPVKEISAESVRDKSIRHGHISTLHLWWARRPLPVCRAIVFASLVPDPLDPHCPPAFRDAVELLLGKAHNPGDPYRPYADIPWTAIYDPMEDNLRNRLQMFIGRFSAEAEQAMLLKRPSPPAGKMLADSSLIKWDNKNNEDILNIARKLIWVAHNSLSFLREAKEPTKQPLPTAAELLADFDRHFTAIKTAEQALYSLPDRHLPAPEVQTLETALHQAIEAFLDRMPRVFDPFAGGGAIPLEAARLGCRAFGNDINPVAHIIQKGSLEFPQKYGKPVTYTKSAFIARYGQAAWDAQPLENKRYTQGDATAVHLHNRLSFDVEHYARELLRRAEVEIGHYYPANEKGAKPIAYYWARVGTCSNPSCRAEVPLLKGFYLCNKPDKKVYLKPVIEGKEIRFEVRNGECQEDGWIKSRQLICPCCKNATNTDELKRQSIQKLFSLKLLAVIDEGENGKFYRPPLKEEELVVNNIPSSLIINEEIVKGDSRNLWLTLWGIDTWGDMFTPRQLLALHTLVEKLRELKAELHSTESDYGKAVATYLGILVDRVAIVNTSFGVWHTSGEKLERPMGRQAIPMVFDYPESNPFCNATGSISNQIEWLTRYVESESGYPFQTILQNASSGEREQFLEKSLTAVVTDPPYYDAIAYADLSDFFYVWLKRTLADVFPLTFTTPQTPKVEECTALKHHHQGKLDVAKLHFEHKLLQIFKAIEHQTSDVVSIMFAHQSTEAWTTLCNSILGANMNITGSWANDTEMTGALKTDKAFLSSSVTVSCRPAQRQGIGDFKTVKKAIEARVEKEVEQLYELGFRGADLLTACFGQAVSEFGRYQAVEKADGSRVTVAELLEMARESAFNALLKGFQGDDYTKFYIAWLQLYGFTESDFNDAAMFSRVALTINVQELFKENILIKNQSKQSLGNFESRISANKKLGEPEGALLIDQVHRALHLYRGANRGDLLRYLAKVAAQPADTFWRVLTVLCEVLPAGSEDLKQAQSLLMNKDSLLRESQTIQQAQPTQTQLDF